MEDFQSHSDDSVGDERDPTNYEVRSIIENNNRELDFKFDEEMQEGDCDEKRSHTP